MCRTGDQADAIFKVTGFTAIRSELSAALAEFAP